MTDFTVKEVTVFTVAYFLNEALKEVFNRATGLSNVIYIRNNKFRLLKLRFRQFI